MNGGKHYGDILYWGTMAGSALVIVGSFMALVLGDSWMPIHQQYALLMGGQTLNHVPIGTVEFYTTGDGVILIGLCAAVLSVVPAILATLPHLWASGARIMALCGLLNAVLIFSAAVYSIS
ncbi:MAG: hypothetical protein PSN46_07385 [Gammaproteobacteria bacterium]|nr:hypothetical protein [Gammaproteobacteria bacterium]